MCNLVNKNMSVGDALCDERLGQLHDSNNLCRCEFYVPADAVLISVMNVMHSYSKVVEVVVKGPSLKTPDDSYSFESRRLTYVTRAVRCEQCPYVYSISPRRGICTIVPLKGFHNLDPGFQLEVVFRITVIRIIKSQFRIIDFFNSE